MRQRGYFFLALIFALLAAGAVFLYLQQLEHQVKQDVEYKTIPVAREHIPAHTKITPEMLTNKEVPLSQVRADALQNGADISGATSKVPFYPGEPMIEEKLVFAGQTHGGPAYLIAPGKRAVAIAVNEVIAVGNLLMPGDQVDVIAVLEQKQAEGNISFSTIFVQDIRVLAVGQMLTEGQKAPPGATVTLEVSPDEAQKLVLAAEKGSIRLLLRPVIDGDVFYPAPTTICDFIERTTAPVPALPAEAT